MLCRIPVALREELDTQRDTGVNNKPTASTPV